MTGALDLLDTTWPAAGYSHAGGFTIRDGHAGGSRVSAATADTDGYDEAGIDAAFVVSDVYAARDAVAGSHLRDRRTARNQPPADSLFCAIQEASSL